MDSQTQLAESNNGTYTNSAEGNAVEVNNATASSPSSLTDQSVANSIQASLQTEQNAESQFSAFLNGLIDSFKEFSQSGKPLLISLAWALAALLVLRVLLAVVGTVNSIPLLAPLFRLIGALYAVWFTNRYLLKASTRQEISQKIKNFTEQAFARQSDSELAITVADPNMAAGQDTTVSDSTAEFQQ